MAGDFNKPQVTSSYANYSSEIRDIVSDLAKMLDSTGTSNIPNGAIRWNSSSGKFQKYNGTLWSDLASLYYMNVDTVDGYHAGTGASQLLVLDTSGKVPLANIPSTLTGKDADTVDGYHASSFDKFPSSTKMVFFQAAAPTGWTQDTAHNDKALRVVSGAGGGYGGINPLSAPPSTNHMHTTGDHTLTVTEMPAHTHQLLSDLAGASGGGGPDAYLNQGSSSLGYTASTGGGGVHNHGNTGAAGPLPFAPQYINVIVCTKN